MSTTWWGFGIVAWLAGCGGDGADVADDVQDTETESESETETESETESETETETDVDLPDDPCVTQLPVVDIGTGDSSFLALTSGQDIELVHGAQGGWHVPLAINASHVPQLVRMTMTITDVETGTLMSIDDVPLQANLALVPPVLGQPWACSGFYPKIEGRLKNHGLDPEIDDVWIDLCGRTIEVHATLSTVGSELLGEDRIQLVVQPDPTDGPHCP